MTAQNLILTVDDQSVNFDLVKLALKNKYDLSYLASGEECLEKMADIKPALVLLDVQMSGIDGYETCRRLKENNATKETPVIFVSALDNIEERVAGYEAGGDDYIVKPFLAEELVKKIDVALKNKQAQEKLKQDLSSATEGAITAITMSAELGVVLNFLGSCHKCKTFEELGQSVAETLNQYQLKSVMQIWDDEETVHVDSEGILRPLEISVLDKLKIQKRIYDFGARTAYNFPHISVLVKNMPLDDPDLYGRHKDNVALLIEGAEARLSSIIDEKLIEKQQQTLLDLVDATRTTLTHIDEKNHKNKISSSRIMNNLVIDIEQAFVSLDLGESQEIKIMDLIQNAANLANSLYDEGLEVDDELNKLVSRLEQVLN